MNNIPETLQYSETHEWILVDGETVTMDITEYAQHMLGDMVYIELPEVGDEVQVGDEFGVLESVKAASDLVTPLSGSFANVPPQVNEYEMLRLIQDKAKKNQSGLFLKKS